MASRFFGVLQAGLGPAQDLHRLAHRGRVVGLLLELSAEHFRLGRGHLLAPPLDLLLPVIGPILLEPVPRPPHLGLDRAQGRECIFRIERQCGPKVLERSIEWTSA